MLGLMAAAVGSYGLLDASAPFVLGVPALSLGLLALAGALLLGGRRSQRSRYRPDPWAFPEWVTAFSALAMVVGIVVAGRAGAVLEPSVQPLEWPSLPWAAAAGIALGVLPAWLTPLPPMLATLDAGPTAPEHRSSPKPWPPVAPSLSVSPSRAEAAP